ncbi:MAG: hypothetical protein WBL88_02520 [Nitrososphaeraceae archaeon]
MTSKLPNNFKSLVIQEWLSGTQRNRIAAENGLSAGAVTNLVNEWSRGLGFAIADDLRELAVTMKKVGITAAQCASGFRAAMIMNKIGVKEGEIEYFVSEIYNRCKEIGLSADNIDIYLQGLLEFSKTSGMSILPISKIADYLREKTEEKIELENQIEDLKQEIQELNSEWSASKKLRDDALQQQKMTAFDLQWYSDLKAHLSKHMIPVHDVAKFAKTVEGIRKYGYDVNSVVSEFSNLEILKLKQNTLQENVQSLEIKLANLRRECFSRELELSSHNETISKHKLLEGMGFGLKELTLLWNIVNEIAEANNIPQEMARLKFITDIEEQYDKKLGFESKLEKLQTEVNNVNQALTRRRIELSTLQLVGPALAKLIQIGLREQDIINVASIFETYFTGIDRQSLISELDKYGGLKSAMQKLGEENKKLNDNIASLKEEKHRLEMDNQRMASALINSNHKMFFLQGYMDSLRYEIAASALIATIIAYLLKSQIEDLQGMKFFYYNDFLPSIRSDNGENDIPLQDIRKGVIKALEILLDRIKSNDNNNKLTEILSNTKNVLLQEEYYN